MYIISSHRSARHGKVILLSQSFDYYNIKYRDNTEHNLGLQTL